MTPPAESPDEPTEQPGSSTGPPDRQTLRLLERQCAAVPLVADTQFQPSATAPRRLVATLDTDAFPEAVADARLDIRWFTTGDFSLH